MAEFGDDAAASVLDVTEKLSGRGTEALWGGVKKLTRAGWIKALEARRSVAAEMGEGITRVGEIAGVGGFEEGRRYAIGGRATLIRKGEFVWIDFDFRDNRLPDGSPITYFTGVERDIVAQLQGAGAPEFDFVIKDGIGGLRYRAADQKEMVAAIGETSLAFQTRLEEARERGVEVTGVDDLVRSYAEDLGLKPVSEMSVDERRSLVSSEGFSAYAAEWAEEEGRLYRARGVDVRFTYVASEGQIVAEYPKGKEKAFRATKEAIAGEREKARAESLREKAGKAKRARGKEPFSERIARAQEAARDPRATKQVKRRHAIWKKEWEMAEKMKGAR